MLKTDWWHEEQEKREDILGMMVAQSTVVMTHVVRNSWSLDIF